MVPLAGSLFEDSTPDPPQKSHSSQSSSPLLQGAIAQVVEHPTVNLVAASSSLVGLANWPLVSARELAANLFCLFWPKI